MAKKIFARARVVKGARWHIDYTIFDPNSGQESRHRKDFDLNDIENIEVRAATADIIARNIEHFIAAPGQEAKSISVQEGVKIAFGVKMNLPRANSHKQYVTVSKHFLQWAKARGYDTLGVPMFGRRQAREFWDSLKENKFRARTQTNYLTGLRALWAEMIERELAEDNPWSGIKPPKRQEKLRRPFTADEKRAVAEYVEKHNYWLFRGILLQYFCYIRPVELTRLKFRDFDLAQGLVTVQEEAAKSWKKSVKTIPKSIMHYFLDGIFDRQAKSLFVFGRVGDKRRGRLEPSNEPIHENRLYKTHAKILAKLKAMGKIGDTQGLSWYSWKDTGISANVRRTSPLATKDQAGHESLDMTSLYYHQEVVNTDYLRLENDLVG